MLEKEFVTILEVDNESSYIKLLSDSLLNQTELTNIIVESIKMSSRNSSMRKDEMAYMYAEKIAKQYKLELDLCNIELVFGIEDKMFMPILGRAMHNITYLDGPLKIKIKEENKVKYIMNEYKKLGQKRIIKRICEIVE